MKKKLLLITLFFISVVVFANDTTNQKYTEKTTATFVTKGTLTVAIDVVKFESSSKEEEVTIDGKDVHISGNDNKLNLKGAVIKILITGKNNDITIESVDEIVIINNYNFVSWEKTINGNQKPIIQDKGGYNNIGKKSGNALEKKDN